MSEWLIPLITLTALEIVLGIDNIIFLAILAGRLPKEQQRKARNLGLLLALVMRLGLLLFINLLMNATATLFSLPAGIFSDNSARDISLKDLILIVGGLFLVGKATYEIHHKLEGDEEVAHTDTAGKASKLGMVLLQIVAIDIVFSLDSVITAVGMVKTEAAHTQSIDLPLAVGATLNKNYPDATIESSHAHLLGEKVTFDVLLTTTAKKHLQVTLDPDGNVKAEVEKPADRAHGPSGIWIIVIAMVLTCLVMLVAAGPVGDFVNHHPTLKILALSFLILIGVLLIAEGFGQHINKGYIYFAMAFSLVVELINMRVRSRQKPVELHEPKMPTEA